jgi:hypothetical protein
MLSSKMNADEEEEVMRELAALQEEASRMFHVLLPCLIQPLSS